jgi:hypothetical protein
VVVDPDVEVVKVYARAPAGSFSSATELSNARGDVIETPILPGFRLALGELFSA